MADNDTAGSIVLFAKRTTPGSCKSRLAAKIGEQAAAEFARHSLNDTLARCQALMPTFISPPADDKQWFLDNGYTVDRVQQGDNLGQKMLHGLRACMHGRACAIVGTDCPDAPFEEIAKWIIAVDVAVPAMAFGPASDGGFWTIVANQTAMIHIENDVFDPVVWSSGSELSQCVSRLENIGVSIHLLSEAHDVDTLEDLENLQNRLTTQPVAPSVAKWLSGWRRAKDA